MLLSSSLLTGCDSSVTDCYANVDKSRKQAIERIAEIDARIEELDEKEKEAERSDRLKYPTKSRSIFDEYIPGTSDKQKKLNGERDLHQRVVNTYGTRLSGCGARR
jgi:hypothetical protein